MKAAVLIYHINLYYFNFLRFNDPWFLRRYPA